MQTFICSLIVIAAALYAANRWMPFQIKQWLLQLFGKTPLPQNNSAACGSCSSCGGCGSKKVNSTKL